MSFFSFFALVVLTRFVCVCVYVCVCVCVAVSAAFVVFISLQIMYLPSAFDSFACVGGRGSIYLGVRCDLFEKRAASFAHAAS